MTDEQRPRIKFRYRLGPHTVFAKDANISVEQAKFLVEGNPTLTGGRIEKAEVVEDGRELEFTVSFPEEVYDQIFGEISLGDYSFGFNAPVQ